MRFYYTSRGAKSPDSYHVIAPVYVDIFLQVISVKKQTKKQTKPAEKKVAQEFHFFIFITHLEEKRTRFAESSSSNIKRLISYAAPESKKVDKICCQLALPKLMGNT